MRKQPTWRIPFGLLALLLSLLVYAAAVARYLAPLMSGWPVAVQTLAYVALGVIWLLPLKRFLIWMETGRWG